MSSLGKLFDLEVRVKMQIDEDIPDIIDLEFDEKVIHILHRKFISFIFPFLMILAIIVGSTLTGFLGILFDPFILFYVLPVIIIVIGFILGTVISVGLLLGYFYCRGHVYLITNKRIIYYMKFVSKNLRELRYPKISDTVFQQGPFGRLFNYSSITLTSPGMEGGFTARGGFTFLFSIKGIENGLTIREDIIKLIDLAG